MNTTMSSPDNDVSYPQVYTGMICGLLILEIARGYIFVAFTTTASKHLHDKMLQKILKAPITFFEDTPIGKQ